MREVGGRERVVVSAASSGIGFPLVTVLVAFAIGGLVVLLTGSDPFDVYKSLWVGAGFDWPFQFLPGNPFGVDPLARRVQPHARRCSTSRRSS